MDHSEEAISTTQEKDGNHSIKHSQFTWNTLTYGPTVFAVVERNKSDGNQVSGWSNWIKFG